MDLGKVKIILAASVCIPSDPVFWLSAGNLAHWSLIWLTANMHAAR